MDRIIEVAFSDNIDLDAAVAANDAVIAAYATRTDRPDFPFWPMLFANLTIRLFGSDDFPLDARHQAATDLTEAARTGDLTIPFADAAPPGAGRRGARCGRPRQPAPGAVGDLDLSPADVTSALTGPAAGSMLLGWRSSPNS